MWSFSDSAEKRLSYIDGNHAYSLSFEVEEDQDLEQHFKIKRLSFDKAAEFADLLWRSLKQTEKDETRQTARSRRLLKLNMQLEDPNSSIFIATWDKELIGGVGIGPLHGLDPSEGIGEIRDLVVDEHFRRRGLGQELLKAALIASKENKFKQIYLEISQNMTSAQRLFESFGFRAVESKSQPLGMPVSEEAPCYYLLENADKLLKALETPKPKA